VRTGEPGIRVTPTTAEALWQTPAGGAVIVRNHLGSGQVIFSTDPLEYNQKESLAANASLYRSILQAGGVQPVDVTPYVRRSRFSACRWPEVKNCT